MSDRNSFVQAGGVRAHGEVGLSSNVPELSGAEPKEMQKAYPTGLVHEGEMVFSREFAEFAYTVVHNQKPSELALKKMEENFNNSVQSPWNFTKETDAQAIANQIINSSKNVRSN